jgi:hypothetical protein
MDVFILPTTLVQMYKEEIVDPKTKAIALTPKMLDILRGLYDEIFEMYPQLDGIMIRVGENYLPKGVRDDKRWISSSAIRSDPRHIPASATISPICPSSCRRHILMATLPSILKRPLSCSRTSTPP